MVASCLSFVIFWTESWVWMLFKASKEIGALGGAGAERNDVPRVNAFVGGGGASGAWAEGAGALWGKGGNDAVEEVGAIGTCGEFDRAGESGGSEGERVTSVCEPVE